MRLDTNRPFEDTEPSSDHLKQQLVAISQYARCRGAEEDWAQHLRFLTPVLEAEETFSSGDGADSSGDEYVNSDTCESSMELCSCNDFSSRQFHHSDRNLRLTEPEDLPDCIHYVAVSYCWNSSERTSYAGEPFRVHSSGAVRSPTCPSSMLQRVIEWAHFCKCHFIWIDQECMDQRNAEDKQTGIQAMDLVYQRASFSVAVLEVEITEQRHIDALEVMLEGSPDEMGAPKLLDLIQLLELIAGDPWFERAWTLQESTSGSRQMTLLVRNEPALHTPYSMWMRNGNIELELSQLHNILSSWLPMQLSICKLSADLLSRWNRFLARWFDVMVPEVSTEFDVEKRIACNGAEALAYLKTRSNSVISDRLGIMANLCQYSIRLDTIALDNAGFDFSLCALTLAVLNGDMSVLIGLVETQDGSSRKVASLQSEDEHTKRHGFSWCVPGQVSLDRLAYLEKDADILRIQVHSLSGLGLEVEGCIWVADRVIDLSSIRSHLLESYKTFDLFYSLSTHIDDTLVHDWSTRTRAIRVAAMVQLLSLLNKKGYAALASQIWSYLRLKPTKSQLEASEEVRSYAVACFEDIVDVQAQVVSWPSPIPKLPGWSSSNRLDPFAALYSGFPVFLLRCIIETGELVVARPAQLPAAECHYQGIFDTAKPGHCFFSPRNNFGSETPRSQYTWYPMNWRVSPILDQGYGHTSFSCHGLVAGNWQCNEIYSARVHLA